MAPKFGTSGLRGLVIELTPELIADYVHAFLQVCPIGTGLFVARDLRQSSPDIASWVIATARRAGYHVTDCGAAPTPALALAAMDAGAASIMITGSHIPADRNGLKFYLPSGEISKHDELNIVSALGQVKAGDQGELGQITQLDVGPAWVARYVQAFGATSLQGLRVGVWSHSSVARDLLLDVLTKMGARTVELGRSDDFIPVDTEAVPSWARENIVKWCAEHSLDALVSTDGDGDRPLLADSNGNLVLGDILGQITARVVDAEVVVTPISSNSGVDVSKHFKTVVRTRIGSPFVIAGMQQSKGRMIGYEANGGFLLGFDAKLPNGPMKTLPTRDSLLPILAPLSLLITNKSLADIVSKEPARFTASDRIESVPSDQVNNLIAEWKTDADSLAEFFAGVNEIPATTDVTDGLRITLTSGNIAHFRPSGNAPELRIYVEAGSNSAAEALLRYSHSKLADYFSVATG
jgi:phosphomannomutase